MEKKSCLNTKSKLSRAPLPLPEKKVGLGEAFAFNEQPLNLNSLDYLNLL